MPAPSPAALKARRKRVQIGLDTEAAARKTTPKLSLQGVLQFPLLEEIDNLGGQARPGEVYDRLAQRLDVPDEIRAETRVTPDGSQQYRWYEQQVRWARQTAVMRGLIVKDQRGIWELTDLAHQKLGKAKRGVTVLVYSLDDGVAIWGRAEDVASTIDKGSISLLMCSPPYPVVSRAYGKLSVPEWLSWMDRLTGMWRELITPDGTIAINLMDVFVSGTPCLSPYVERFTLNAIDKHGLHLAGRLPWHSPAKLGHIEWAVKRRVRPRNTMEHVILLSRDPHPNWSTRRWPAEDYKPRSASAMRRDAIRTPEERPSGYLIRPDAFARTSDGPVPSNLIVAGGASGSDAYSRRCRDTGHAAHPARYPEELPRRVIQLTTEEGQTVYDPMAGSNTTGKVALDLGRRFIASDAMLSYMRSSAVRFEKRDDLAIVAI